MQAPRRTLLLLTATLVFSGLTGCAQLLPKAQAELKSPWASFEEAKLAIEGIESRPTTAADLHALGLDPYSSPNVQLLTYSDIVLRFPLAGGIGHLDAGLRECLEAGKACRGYVFNARGIQRERIGNYWQDALGFKRVVELTGWNFNALILLVRDRVVYTLYGGQPHLHEVEVTRRPLGPLQEWPEDLPFPNLIR